MEKAHTFGVRVDDETFEKLQYLATATGRSKGAVVRLLIRQAVVASFREVRITHRDDRAEPSDDKWEAQFHRDWEAFCVKYDVGARIWNAVRRKIQGWGNGKSYERPQTVKAFVQSSDHWSVMGIGEKSRAILNRFAVQEQDRSPK